MTDEAASAAPSEAALAAAFDRLRDIGLARAAEGGDRPVAQGPADPFRAAPPGRDGVPLDEALEELIAALAVGMNTDHPRFFAFIPSPASPISWLAETAVAIHNQHAGSTLQSGGATAIERATVRWLADEAGFPEGAGGLVVSGGSIANLTALVAARDRMLAEDERHLGTAYLTPETHASVARALRIAGVADRRIRRVATDGFGQMDVSALEAAIAADRDAGLKPFVIAATAGATNSGAIDPLPAIADLAAAERLWMHVDGAYGASALLSPAHRGLLAGIGRADSLAWDAHKWLFQTYGCGLVLVRDRAALTDSFALGADYLRDGVGEDGEPNGWDMGPELTRPARAARLWLTARTMGRDALGAAVAHGFTLAEAAERAVRATPGWTVVSPARMAILLFRFAPEDLSPEVADALNAAAAKELMRDGFAMVGATRVHGRTALRICAIHPRARAADMAGTIARLDVAARRLAGRRRSGG